jgi:FG-GAP-like repeat
MLPSGPFRQPLSRRRFLQTCSGVFYACAGLVGDGRSLFASKGNPPIDTQNPERSHEPLFLSISPNTSGIHWRHTSGRSKASYLPETTGAGCAFFDYDNDGWMDIYLVNSGKCDFFDPSPPLRNALYRNNRDGTFTDVTAAAGLQGGGYGMGVAVGDYDGDGLPDIYLTQYGRNILYHNEGNGRFVDVTEKAGVAAPGWSSSAAWFDYDGDGRLDPFVCRFVDFSKEKNIFCGDPATGEGHYCIPRVYSQSYPIQDEPEGEVRFQYKMSLERMAC